MRSFLLIAVIFATLQSCKKCADCTTTTQTIVSKPTVGYPQTSVSTFELCGGKDIDRMDGNVVVTKTTSGTATATSTATTKCVVKNVKNGLVI